MRTFTAIDRCDRCGAQAYHSATKSKFSELLFCNHHYNDHRDALVGDYWLITSDISPLEPVPASAYTE